MTILSTSKPQPGTEVDASALASNFQGIESVVNGELDEGNFRTGALYSPSKLKQGGAHVGDALVWNGSAWVPARGFVSNNLVDAKGDLLAAVGDNDLARVPVGSDGQVLTAAAAEANGVKWVTPPDTTPTGPAGGDLTGTYPNPTFAQDMATQTELNGVSAAVVTAQAAADAASAAATSASGTASAAVPKSLVDAKGDLVAASANDTPARLPIGTDGQVLSADSAQTTGLKWIAPPAGGGGGGTDYEGAWAAGTPYVQGDVVLHNGTHYMAVNPSTGQAPPPVADPSGAISPALLDAKGDLIAASAADTAARVAVGTDGQVLAANSGVAAGVAWASLGVWQAWNPAITGTTNHTPGAGAGSSGRYCRIGNLVIASAGVYSGAGGYVNGTGQIYINLPVPASSAYPTAAIGSGRIYLSTSATPWYVVVLELVNATNAQLVVSVTTGGMTYTGPPASLNGIWDFHLFLMYEAA